MIEVLVLSLGFSFIISVIYRVLIKPEDGKRIKNDMKVYRDKISKARKEGKMDEVNKLTMESMKISQKQFSLTMKPLAATFILFWVFVTWISTSYADLSIASPFFVPLLTWEFPFFQLSATLNWWWWYIFISIPGSMIFRKALGAYPY